MMKYKLITDEETLKSVCDKAAEADAIAIDTEFVRTRTLTPQLGLLQMFDGEQLVLIDPLSMDDLSPFVALMSNENVVKVLHSCSEDLETFLAAFGIVPAPIFDTQFAASILDMGPTLGYARLVELMSNVVLDKGESRTDWLARPLRESQLSYAANDVLYLLPVYRQLAEQITEAGKYEWVTQEIATLAEKKKAQVPLELAYLHLKNLWRLNPEQLTVFRHLAAWRLKVARQKNLALNFVIRESQMFDIAVRMPSSRSALSRIEGLQPQTLRRYGEILIGLVAEARELYEDTPAEKQLTTIHRLIDYPEYKKNLAAVKRICATVAQEQGVTEDVIASKKQINQLLKWQWFSPDETRTQGLLPDLLSGWRRPLLEKKLSSLLGPLAFDK